MSGIATYEQEIVDQGYTLINDVDSDEEAESVLSQLGVLIPQYNGKLRYEVSAGEDHNKRAYSKSINGIPWHVDAPSWEPPPSRMAMHCRRQATCGSGHTNIADMRLFVAQLSDSDRAGIYEREVAWIDRNTGTGVKRPIVERTTGGREIIRYRHSILKGDSDKRLLDSPEESMPLGDFGLSLAAQAEEFFATQGVAVLIPNNSILAWDNQRMAHGRNAYQDPRRLLTRYWMADLS